jgi:hypothetical protein
VQITRTPIAAVTARRKQPAEQMLPTILRSHPLKHGYVENTEPIVCFGYDAAAMKAQECLCKRSIIN